MKLFYSANPLPPAELPTGIDRTSISSPHGKLEVLSALPTYPTTASEQPNPIVFVHGGFGGAVVWANFMTFLSQCHGIPCYAVSLRGHGQSWMPGFFQMVWRTSRRDLANDIVTAVKHVEAVELERRGVDTRVVLVAHSNGGGLAQTVLDAGDVQVAKFALLHGTPSYGLFWVYWNWLKLDPWFVFRAYWHLGHPNSPVSSIPLLKQVFFSNNMATNKVVEFSQQMSSYESLMWPMSMMGDFVNVKRIVSNVLGLRGAPRVLILGGGSDQIMRPDLMLRMAQDYRRAMGETGQTCKSLPDEDVQDGVMFTIIPGLAHQGPNDTLWRDAAEKLGRFCTA